MTQQQEKFKKVKTPLISRLQNQVKAFMKQERAKHFSIYQAECKINIDLIAT